MQDFSKHLDDIILTMKKKMNYEERIFQSYSFGTVEQSLEMLEMAMKKTDKTIDNFIRLPEYELVAKWMSDTKGKGLFLTGDVGLGKTSIINHALPALFMANFNKIVNCYHADDVHKKLTDISKKKFIAIDDMGTETIANDFGTKYESVAKIIEKAESEHKVLFISSNLNSTDFIERYGVRTFDRIMRLCKVIKFTGQSLRR